MFTSAHQNVARIAALIAIAVNCMLMTQHAVAQVMPPHDVQPGFHLVICTIDGAVALDDTGSPSSPDDHRKLDCPVCSGQATAVALIAATLLLELDEPAAIATLVPPSLELREQAPPDAPRSRGPPTHS